MSFKSIFETMGQARILEDEGNRQIAAAVSASARALTKRFWRLFGKAMRSTPGEHQLP